MFNTDLERNKLVRVTLHWLFWASLAPAFKRESNPPIDLLIKAIKISPYKCDYYFLYKTVSSLQADWVEWINTYTVNNILHISSCINI